MPALLSLSCPERTLLNPVPIQTRGCSPLPLPIGAYAWPYVESQNQEWGLFWYEKLG